MTQQQRRRALRRLGALGTWGGLAWLGNRQALATPTPATAAAGCPVVPQETEGPFPADGTAMQPPLGGPGMPPPGGPGHPAPGLAGHPPAGPGHPPPTATPEHAFNVLTLPGITRSDLRRNLDGSNEAGGVPLTLRLRLVSRSACAPLAGHAIYVWHCTREGDYSVYGSGKLEDNRLRGVQVTDAHGEVTFTTIVPGCYQGRMPHVHCEIYASLAQAVNGRNALTTSQLAFPNDTMARVYGQAPGYQASAGNLARMSFATDMVFADGLDLQMATMRGSLAQGFEARLQVAIAG